MKNGLYEMLLSIAMVMEYMETVALESKSDAYKIPNKRVKHSYVSGKTFYQNPNLKMRSYYNKVPRKNKFSTVSLRGKEIKANNRRKNIEDKLKNK